MGRRGLTFLRVCGYHYFVSVAGFKIEPIRAISEVETPKYPFSVLKTINAAAEYILFGFLLVHIEGYRGCAIHQCTTTGDTPHVQWLLAVAASLK